MGVKGEASTLRLLCLLTYISSGLATTWSEWWTYEGISGPDFWGRVNPDWTLCTKGKRQSPVNIDPRHIVYDPFLRHLHVDGRAVSGTIINSGHDVKLLLDESTHNHINISHGPLSYQYRVSEILLHFGRTNETGSEHTLEGIAFPAEIGDKSNPTIRLIADKLRYVRYKGEQTRIRHVPVSALLPDTKDYMTYEGSLTQPACYESVTWVLMNKVIPISNDDLIVMRELMQGSEDSPKSPMYDNFRPTMAVNHRSIRTNINFPPGTGCSLEKRMYYRVYKFGTNHAPYPSLIAYNIPQPSTHLIIVKRYVNTKCSTGALMSSTQANQYLLTILLLEMIALQQCGIS